MLLDVMQVKAAYINFLNHCYIDTEVEMKEIYTSSHMWTLFESFFNDIVTVCSATHDRPHADKVESNLSIQAPRSLLQEFIYFQGRPAIHINTTFWTRFSYF